MTELDEYWAKFLKDTNRDPEEKCSGDLFFEAKGFVGDQHIFSVLNGKKTAVFSSFPSFAIDQEPLPLCGELYLLQDKNEKPVCVIELEAVEILPFYDVPWELAKQEGEDQNLEEWRTKHWEYLEDEAEIMGFTVTPDVKMVFQKFKVIYR